MDSNVILAAMLKAVEASSSPEEAGGALADLAENWSQMDDEEAETLLGTENE